MNDALCNHLHSAAPDPARVAGLDLYAFLIGDWSFDARVVLDDGSEHQGRGEIHAGWILEGRALQDVWILPGVFHGTTLRVYDPARDDWLIQWSDPLHLYFSQQRGRAVGADIVQVGAALTGEWSRWSFRARERDRFTWRGEVATPDGGWRLNAEFACRRVGA